MSIIDQGLLTLACIAGGVALVVLLVASCTPQEVGLVAEAASGVAALTGHPGASYALSCFGEAFCAAGGPH